MWKIYLSALNKSKILNESKQYQDINVSFKNSDQPLIIEVKKVGVIIDRGQEFQFRAGDQLIIYVSMGGFEK